MGWTDLTSNVVNTTSNIIESVKATLVSWNMKEDPEDWHPNINWTPLKEAFPLAKRQGLPLVLIIKNRYCPTCRALKSLVRRSDELAEMSKNFVMVVEEDAFVPDLKKFYPDGRYVPRVLFFSPDGKFMAEYTNDFEERNTKYFYPNVPTLMKTMKRIKKEYSL